MKIKTTYDYIIIGSGFGGSVSAHRLSEKGYSVAVLEKGKRHRAEDFPKTNMNVRKFIWAPFAKCFGIQKITLFKNVFILSGVGVGGGSLVYANTLMKPKSGFFKDPAWSGLADWETVLEPHYATARRMLGATTNTHFFAGDEILKSVGKQIGCGDTFDTVDVGVYFGKPDTTVPDPYFGGKGPDRTGCNFCGGCMVGCRYGAKNTLDKNYLYLAEKNGTQIFAETEVVKVVPEKNGSGEIEGYRVETRKSTSWFGGPRQTFKAKKVIFSGGVLGSVKLLLENKHIHGTLPNISNQLGRVIRTNGESLVGATAVGEPKGFSKGIAITSAIHPDEQTKVEVVRYSQGSDFMRLLAVPLTGPGSMLVRPIKMAWTTLRHLKNALQLWGHRDWANNTIILLVMQQIDNQIAFGIKRAWYRLFTRSFGSVKTGLPRIPAYIAVADRAARVAADLIGGFPQMAFSEPLLNAPATAHILGGAKISATAEDGVVDRYCRIHGYPDLYVVDGSIIPANLGVNPSLTITTLAEYAMAQIPAKGQYPN